jgi:HK97 family phage major capsid protein
MARETFEDWTPNELATQVIQAPNTGSAVEQVARREIMTSDVKQFPRSGGFTAGVVAKGAAYGESAPTNDFVELTARKLGGIVRIAEEDLNDSAANILAAKSVDGARAISRLYDNAALGTSAAANGTTVPFNSVYKAVTTANFGGITYTASSNLVATSTLTYANLVNFLGKVGAGEWGSDMVIIAHPGLLFQVMGLTDSAGQPLLRDVLENGYTRQKLLGVPVVPSLGAVVTATASSTPGGAGGVAGTAGNQLMIVANRDLLINGVANLPGVTAGAPGFALQRAADGAGFTTDEALLKAAMRRGFGIGNVLGVAALEKIA